MRIKHSLAALTLFVSLCITLPVAAYATTISPALVSANEQMEFSPHIFVLVLLVGLLLSMVAVLLHQLYKLWQTQMLVGRGIFDVDAYLNTQDLEPIFDYGQVETPEEFIFYTEQSTLAMQGAVARLGNKPKYVPRHQRLEMNGVEDGTDQPHIRLVPEMKHARRKAAHAAAIEIPVELEELLRKIS